MITRAMPNHAADNLGGFVNNFLGKLPSWIETKHDYGAPKLSVITLSSKAITKANVEIRYGNEYARGEYHFRARIMFGSSSEQCGENSLDHAHEMVDLLSAAVRIVGLIEAYIEAA